jgi:hypothetical protein
LKVRDVLVERVKVVAVVRHRSSLSLLAVALISAWLSASVAVAGAPDGESATITNFDPQVIGDTRGPYGAPAVVVDTDGDAVDAHDGRLRYFGGRYYWYGTAYRCGYALWDLDGTRPVQPGATHVLRHRGILVERPDDVAR